MRKLYSFFYHHSFFLFLQKASAFKKISFLFLFYFLVGFNASFAQGPGPEWQYKRDITLSAGTPLADYQVQITLSAGQYAGMNADGSDLRFYAGATPCSYWIEEGRWNTSGQSFVWVKVPTAGTTTLTMYYGNPAATATPGTDGDNTFDFFDGFNGTTLNTTKWTNHSSGGGNVVVNGGQVSLNNTNNVASIYTPSPFSTGGASSFIIEAKHKETGYYRNRYYASDKNTASGGGGLQYLPSSGTVPDYGLWGGSGGTSTGNVQWGSLGVTINAGVDYLMRWDITQGGNFTWSNYLYSNLTPISTKTATVAVSINYLIFSVTENTNASTIIDWVRVRKSTATPYNPTVTLGTQVSLPPTITGFTPTTPVCTDNTTTVPVTISGYNFTGATSVTFNGTAASSFTVVNNNTITALSPAGVTTGKISVTVPSGTATSSTDLTINPLPTVFTLSVPGDGTYCTGTGGLTITLSSSQTGVKYQLYKGVLAQGTAVSGTGSPLTFANQTSGSYTVVATSATTPCSLNMSNTVTIQENIINSFSVNGGGSFCAGGAGIPVGLSGSTAGVIYKLFRGGVSVATMHGTGLAMNFANQATAGTYTVTATLNGCEKVMDGSATVGINPLPSGSLTFAESSGSGSANDGAICLGDNVTFTATPDASFSYNFKVNGIDVNPPVGSNVYSTTTLPVGSQKVKVAIINTATSCSITSAEQTILVNPLPTPTLSVSKNNICPGESVTFTAGGGNFYTFYINNVQKVASASATYTYSAFADGDKVSVAVKNGNGCTKLSSEITMSVKPLPGAAGPITGTSEPCQESSGTYTVGTIDDVNGAQPYVWAYTGTGAPIISNGNQTITINFSNSATSGMLTVRGKNGCDFGTASPDYYIAVNTLPTATVSGTTTVCQNSAQPNITFTGSTGVAPYTFTYKINGGANQTISTTSGNSVSIPISTNAATSFTYTLVSVSDIKGCSQPEASSATVTINPLPLTPAKPTGTATICQGSTGTYHVAAITYADVNGYHWAYSGTGATINGDTKDITIDFATNATSGDLTVYGENSCGVGVVSAVYHITINPLPTATITYSTTADNPIECLNSTTQPVITFTGSGGTLPYTFYYLDGAGVAQTSTSSSTNPSAIVNVPTNVAGTLTYTLVSVSDNSLTHCLNALLTGQLSVDVTIKALPVIVLDGKSPICQADEHELYTTEPGMTDYTWVFTGGNKESGGGITDNSLQMLDWTVAGAKSISVNYTDPLTGCRAAAPATVNVTGATTVPVLNGTSFEVCQDGTVTYTTQVDPNYTEYLWTVSAGNTITSGQNSPTVTVDWQNPGDQVISVNFSNDQGCTASSPTQKTVKVNPTTVAGTLSADQAICSGVSAASITLTGNVGDIVKWQKADDFNFTTNVSDIANTTTTLTSAQIGTLTSTTYFRAVVLSGNCNSENTSPATITVSPVTVAGAVSADQEICAGTVPTDLSITGSIGDVVKWQKATNAAFTIGVQDISASATLPGSTIGSLTSTTYFRAVITSGVCSSVNSEVVTVSVDPVSNAGTVSANQTICTGTVPSDITISGNTGDVVKWQSATNAAFTAGVQDIPSSASSTLLGSAIGVLTTPTYFRAVITSGVCSSDNSSIVTVNIDPVSVAGPVSADQTICSGSNPANISISGNTGNIVKWQKASDEDFTTGVTDISVTSTTLPGTTIGALSDTTYFRAIVKSGTCSEAISAVVTVNVNTANGGTLTVNGGNPKCASLSAFSVVLNGNSGNVVRWKTSTDGVNFILNNDPLNYYLNFNSGLSETTWITAITQATPCSEISSDTVKIVVNPRPTGLLSGTNQICVGGSTSLTLALTGSGTIHGTLSDGTPFSGTEGTITLPFSPASSTDYTIATLNDEHCAALASDMNGVGSIYITPTPSPVVISPLDPTICAGGVVPLTSVLSSVENPAPISLTKTVNSTIPNQNLTGLSSSINITGIPLGAIVDSVSVKLNVTHTEVYDIAVNLAAPNGKIITLVASAFGQNFTNTNFSSNGSIYPVITSGTAPFTGTFSAEGQGQFAALFGAANTNSFTDLFGTQVNPPDGNWVLSVYDKGPFGTGTWNNWGLTIYYHVPTAPVAITWSPVDGLYTDPSATIPYTAGEVLATVYAKPTATTTYTGTSVNPASCTPPSQVTVSINPPPDVKVGADYCSVPGKVMLTASKSDGTPFPTGTTYLWNTGETIPSVNVDEAHLYVVSVKTGLGCVGTGLMSVAQELVTNGDFEASFDHNNPGFVTGYSWNKSPIPPIATTSSTNPNRGLIDEGTYAVDTSASIYHYLFHGRDHTTPAQTGKFMMINGAITGGRIIWQQTVNVLPNTNYYYSAWAMNLTGSSPAKLQFSVNGVPIGTIADLNTVSSAGNESGININNWIRFYYGNTTGWNSGSNTTAKITIINLNTVGGGNDFALDDISFATLSTFITKTSDPQSDNQTLCKGDLIAPISYTVGSGGDGPLVQNLPKGVKAEFNGIVLTITGRPDTIGTFNYSVTTQGACAPTTTTGVLVVNGPSIKLSSAAKTDSQVICKGNSLVNIKYTIGGQGNGANAIGLPTGVGYSFASNVLTISGAPNTAGIFKYKVYVTGGCSIDSLEGTITSNMQTISKMSGSDDQTVCINTAIEDIKYEIGGTGTGAHVTTLPSGLSGSYSGGVFTITGTPSVSGVYPFTVTTDGTCGAVAMTGTISITANASISLSSPAGTDNQEICINNFGIDQIIYHVTGNVTNAVATDLPAGLTQNFNISTGILTITGVPTASGTFEYTIQTSGTCVQTQITGTIKVDPAVSGGTLALNYAAECTSASGTLQLSGQQGDVKQWEKSEDGGLTWQPIGSTAGSSSYTFSGITQSTYFHAVIDGGKCGDVSSDAVLVGLHNLWTGTQDNDWQNAPNWSDGKVPTFSTTCADVIIPHVPVVDHQPVLSLGTATVNNIIINQNATLTLNGGIFQVGGAITNNNGIFDAKNGTIEMNGTSAQTIGGSMLKNNALGNLIISNTTGTGVTVSDSLDIYRSLTFGTGGKQLNTGGHLTLKSTPDETAWVGLLNSVNTIGGNVSVERYINLGTGSEAHGKSWQFVSANTIGQTIYNSWMEGGYKPAGYGTWITNIAPATGFDASSPQTSMKYYDDVTNTWVSVDNPQTTPVLNKEGYMIFVRGDRNANTSASPPVPTTLRSKGSLYQPSGNNNPPSVAVKAGKIQSIGNPYPSAIEIAKIGLNNLNKDVTVWDPTISGSYNVGAYQTLTATNGYQPLAGTGLYQAGHSYPNIQSGQAFFVKSDAGTDGSVSFSEAAKVSGSSLMFRGGVESRQYMRAVLYTGNGKVADGSAVAFSNEFSNKVDTYDARKLSNGGENLGMMRNGILLSVEGRSPVTANDTIFYSLTNLKQQSYQLRLAPENMQDAGVNAELIDNFLKTSTVISLVSDTTYFDFIVTSDAASKAAGRFMMVFKTAKALPVTFVSIKAYQKNNDISVEWKVENESDMLQYEVEKSTDGVNFTKVATIAALNTKQVQNYQWIDRKASIGYNYYRIRSIDKNGKIEYSTVLKVSISDGLSTITVTPNPITDGIIHLRLKNQPAGMYRVRLLNTLGQLITGKQTGHGGGNGTIDLNWNYNLSHGIYQLEVIKPSGEVEVIKVMY